MMEGTEWWAVHVFLFDPAASEACLLDDIMPCVRELIAQGKVSSWFFVRYWEGGPHLRIRLAGISPDEQARVLRQIAVHAAQRRSGIAMSRAEYYGQHPFDGEPVSIDALPWYGDGQAVDIPYVPETIRYGGPEAMALSEDVFRVSSTLAVNLIGATRYDFDKRMGAALMLMVAAAAVAGPGAVSMATFCDHYAAMWAQHSAHSRLAAGSVLPPPVPAHRAAVASVLAGQPLSTAFAQRWHETLRAFREALLRLGREGRLISPMDGAPADTPARIDHAVVAILWSQLHMLNNRLAVLPAQEVVLARMVAAAARASGAEEVAAS